MRLAFTLGVLLLMCSQTAPAAQVRFTGRTNADPVLIKDALQDILRVAQANQGCTTLSDVRSTVLPEDYVPEDERYRVAEAKVRYERWDVTLCDRPDSFLFSFWPSPEGGSLFALGYPLPADLPPAGQ